MKKLILPALLIIPLLLAYIQDATIDRAEAIKAFEYLNKVRSNPNGFSQETGTDLSAVQSLPPLKWNDTLAVVARKKALDMARRSYFAHVDPDGNGINILIHKAGYKLPEKWISDKKQNLFESLSAGHDDGITTIRSLIRDEGVSPPFHRQHLLGMDPFWAGCTDIGIGFARAPGSEYGTYTCIIIARHR